MKKMIIFLLALLLMSVTWMAGCAYNTRATLGGKQIAEVRDNGDSPEKIDAKGEFLGRAAASSNATDSAMDEGLRTVNAGIAANVNLRDLGSAIREAKRNTNKNADPTTSPAASKIFTKDGAYWSWSDQPWWYFKEDTAGAHKLSRDNVRDYLLAPDEKQRALKTWGLVD